MGVPSFLAAAAVAALLLTPSAAFAASTAKSHPPIRPHLERRCPALLGTAAQRVKNRERRERRLYWIDDSDGSVTVAHSTDTWGSPVAVVVRGVRLQRVQGNGAERRAVIQLDAAAAHRVGCQAGAYIVEVDDNIGPLRVLALLHDGLLVEDGDRLAYLARRGAPEPQFVLVWGSRYRVVVSENAAPATSSASRYRGWRPHILYGRLVSPARINIKY